MKALDVYTSNMSRVRAAVAEMHGGAFRDRVLPTRTLAFIPASLRYRPRDVVWRICEYDVHFVGWAHHHVKVPVYEPIPLLFEERASFTKPLAVQSVDFCAREWVSDIRLTRRERRRVARDGIRGRRGALRVPVVVRSTVTVYTVDGMREDVIREALSRAAAGYR